MKVQTLQGVIDFPITDWRGNEYDENEQLGKPCEDCKVKPAIRNCCIAEGDFARTHWHGEIHTSDGHIKALCRECAEKDHAKTEEKRKK